MQIAPASLPTDLPAIAHLFRAYAATLPVDFCTQGFDEEIAALPGKYAPPQGALLIARDASGGALGCVAMRRFPTIPPRKGRVSSRARSDAMTGGAAAPSFESAAPSSHPSPSKLRDPSREGWRVCEMKRLYVAPEGRGRGAGRALAHAIIEAARIAGYREMRLDTLAHMHDAKKLYRALGFVEIPRYYDSPIRRHGVHESLPLRTAGFQPA
jgi:putative acetyltransferase